MKTEWLKNRFPRPREISRAAAGINFAQLFDLSQVSQKRRHLYVYSFLLLLILLAHILKQNS